LKSGDFLDWAKRLTENRRRRPTSNRDFFISEKRDSWKKRTGTGYNIKFFVQKIKD
jgi:hypothetical protein